MCKQARGIEELKSWCSQMHFDTIDLDTLHDFRKTVDFTQIPLDKTANQIYVKYFKNSSEYPAQVNPDGNCGFGVFSKGLIGNESLVFELRLAAIKAMLEQYQLISNEGYSRGWIGSCSTSPFNILGEIAGMTRNRHWSDQSNMLSTARALGLEVDMFFPPENGWQDHMYQQLCGSYPIDKTNFNKQGDIRVS